MKKLIGTITMDPGDLHAQAADKIEELRRERDVARQEAASCRLIVAAALGLNAVAAEFDGDLSLCGEYLDALWTACAKYGEA